MVRQMDEWMDRSINRLIKREMDGCEKQIAMYREVNG